MSATVREFFVALSKAEVEALAEWHDMWASNGTPEQAQASEVRAERLRALVARPKPRA